MIPSYSLLLSSFGPACVGAYTYICVCVYVCINFTYKEKSLADNSAPGFNLEDACMQKLSGSVFTEAGS